MGREATFNPVPQTQLGRHVPENLTVTYNQKTKFLSFSRKSPEAKDLIGRFIKFYVDSAKNTLLWKVMDKEKSLGDLEGYNAVKEVDNGQGLAIKVYVPAVVTHALKLNPELKYQKMEVKLYRPGGYLEDGAFHYITFDK